MISKSLIAATFLALPGLAHAQAQTCEDSFTKKGSPLSGVRYTAALTVPDLTPANAINQMRAIGPQHKLDVLTTDAANGNMLMEIPETATHKSIPVVFTAAAEGKASRAELLVKINKYAFSGEKSFKKEMCEMLAKLRGGKAGASAAAAGKNAVATSAPTKIDALMLSLQLARQAKNNAAVIPLRYANKSFTVTGRADYAIKDGAGYRVAFDIPEPHEMLIRPGPMDPQFKIDISCMMAKDQTAYSLSLSKGDKIKLTGSYLDFNEFRHVLWLKDCRPAQ